MNAPITRRECLLAGAGLLLSQAASAFPLCTDAKHQVCNITRLYSVQTQGVVRARDMDDVRRVLQSQAAAISIGGGRYSMGGQTAVANGIQIDMRSFNQLVWLKVHEKTVRVQAGMRWRELQDVLDPFNLSVRTMQSYSNFTVGGAVSVNCHGRYVGHGAMVHSIRALQLVLANGEVLETSRDSHSSLFFAAIGGYGAVAIITEVELNVDDNHKIERSTVKVKLADYAQWFAAQIENDQTAVLHNADLAPPSFDVANCVTWRRSDKPLTELARLTPKHQTYRLEQTALWAMTELPLTGSIRKLAQQIESKPAVHWRNREASLDVAQLEPASRSASTYVLQEYFVPTRHFLAYSQALSALMKLHPHGTLNISIRHSRADHDSLLSWAKEPVFCFVFYYKQRVTLGTEASIGAWTRLLIDLALKYEGTYYLPYQPHAHRSQLERAYPQLNALRTLRKEINATRLSNAMWSRYQV